MHRPTFKLVAGVCVTLLLTFAAPASGQSKTGGAGVDSPPARAPFIKAVVIDERLSALRQEADLHSPVLKRLRIGRTVYITASKGAQSAFYRVPVTRRTRGWIHQGAIALPGRAGEDNRVLKIIES